MGTNRNSAENDAARAAFVGPAYDPDGKCAEDMTDAEQKEMMDIQGFVPARNLVTPSEKITITSEPAGLEYEVEDTRFAQEQAILRIRRTKLLNKSDWSQQPDASSMSDSKKAEWKTYRQKLRDITDGLDEDDLVLSDGSTKSKTLGTLMPTWPTKPS